MFSLVHMQFIDSIMCRDMFLLEITVLCSTINLTNLYGGWSMIQSWVKEIMVSFTNTVKISDSGCHLGVFVPFSNMFMNNDT